MTTLALLVLAAAGAEPPSMEPPEVRAIWVTRWDFRTEGDVRRVVRACALLGLNRVYFQVRGCADAFYRSALEPWGEELGGEDPGFDPLEVALAESRRQGVELHPWVNVLSGWKGRQPPSSPRHIVHTHPEWFLQDRAGKRHLVDADYTMVNPCLPQVRGHLVAVIRDLVERYPVDGLHLDYIRFVLEGFADRRSVPYDAATLSLFCRRTGGFPSRYPDQWDAFRREAVGRVVAEIATAARSVRPRLEITAAVVPDFQRGRKLFLQDALEWLEKGWIDAAVEMNYEADPLVFAYRASLAVKRAGPSRLIHGVGVHLLEGPEALAREISLCRRLGGRGYSLFAFANFFTTPSPACAPGEKARRIRSRLRRVLLDLHGPRLTVPPAPGEARTPVPSARGRAPGGAG